MLALWSVGLLALWHASMVFLKMLVVWYPAYQESSKNMAWYCPIPSHFQSCYVLMLCLCELMLKQNLCSWKQGLWVSTALEFIITSAGWANSITGQKLSVCICVYVGVCCNQCGTSHNRYTWGLVILHVQTYWWILITDRRASPRDERNYCDWHQADDEHGCVLISKACCGVISLSSAVHEPAVAVPCLHPQRDVYGSTFCEWPFDPTHQIYDPTHWSQAK